MILSESMIFPSIFQGLTALGSFSLPYIFFHSSFLVPVCHEPSSLKALDLTYLAFWMASFRLDRSRSIHYLGKYAVLYRPSWFNSGNLI